MDFNHQWDPSHHRDDEHELVGGMERALASALSSVSSLIEGHMRRQQRKAGQDQPAAERERTDRDIAKQIAVRNAARGELAVAQRDGNFWRQATDAEVAEAIRSEYGVDPARVGYRDADRHWAQRADGGEVVAVYETARRWAPHQEVAQSMTDNLTEQLAEWGLDADELTTMDRTAAGERVTLARAAYYSNRGEAQPDGPATTVQHDRAPDRPDRDVQALTLIAAADSIDRVDRTERAHAIAASGPEGRAQAIADRGTNTDAVRGASVAARDFPASPADAIKSDKRTAPKARSGGRSGPDVERGRGM